MARINPRKKLLQLLSQKARAIKKLESDISYREMLMNRLEKHAKDSSKIEAEKAAMRETIENERQAIKSLGNDKIIIELERALAKSDLRDLSAAKKREIIERIEKERKLLHAVSLLKKPVKAAKEVQRRVKTEIKRAKNISKLEARERRRIARTGVNYLEDFEYRRIINKINREGLTPLEHRLREARRKGITGYDLEKMKGEDVVYGRKERGTRQLGEKLKRVRPSIFRKVELIKQAERDINGWRSFLRKNLRKDTENMSVLYDHFRDTIETLDAYAVPGSAGGVESTNISRREFESVYMAARAMFEGYKKGLRGEKDLKTLEVMIRDSDDLRRLERDISTRKINALKDAVIRKQMELERPKKGVSTKAAKRKDSKTPKESKSIMGKLANEIYRRPGPIPMPAKEFATVYKILIVLLFLLIIVIILNNIF
jgi:hypothetical protein